MTQSIISALSALMIPPITVSPSSKGFLILDEHKLYPRQPLFQNVVSDPQFACRFGFYSIMLMYYISIKKDKKKKK